jgi:hypothetical protein
MSAKTGGSIVKKVPTTRLADSVARKLGGRYSRRREPEGPCKDNKFQEKPRLKRLNLVSYDPRIH